MLSPSDIYSRLANNFVGLRFDWEQGNTYKQKLGGIPGTGCQSIMDPEGNPITKLDAFASRYNRLVTPKALDEFTAKYAPKPLALKIEWFLWQLGRKEMWPAKPDDIANYARLPQAVIEGPIPAALQNQDFLRWHVRQFIWVRGNASGESRILIRRVKEGLKPGLSQDIATIAPSALDQFGKVLDQAWLTYMKDRPKTARGYTENKHGGMFASIKDRMIDEEESIRKQAAEGTLPAPGRKPGETAPYLKGSSKSSNGSSPFSTKPK